MASASFGKKSHLLIKYVKTKQELQYLMLLCPLDPTVTFFSETLGNVFKRDIATNVAFTIEVRNIATGAPSVGNDILDVSTGNSNFDFVLQVKKSSVYMCYKNKCQNVRK